LDTGPIIIFIIKLQKIRYTAAAIGFALICLFLFKDELKDFISIVLKDLNDVDKRRIIKKKLKDNVSTVIEEFKNERENQNERPLKERVSKAFNDYNERDFAEIYLNQLFSNSQRTEDKLRKSIIRIFYISFIFFLLYNYSANDFLIGFFKLDKITLASVIKLMPLLISINYYELMSLIHSLSMQARLITQIIRFLHRPIYDAGLESYLLPSATPHYLYYINNRLPGYKKYLFKFFYVFVVVVVLGSALLIEGLIIVMCGMRFGSDDVLLIIVSVMVVAFNVITLFAFLVDYFPDIGERN